MALGHTRCKQCYSRSLIIVINLTNHKDIKVHFVYPIYFQILYTPILFIIKRVTLSQRIYFTRYIYRTILKTQLGKTRRKKQAGKRDRSEFFSQR